MTSKLAADPTDSAKPIRAMLDVMGGDRDPSGNLIDRINPRRFGKDRGRILRKAVLLAIAKNCQPDGSGAFPSIDTIAHRCLVGKRAVYKAIKWLVARRLLHVESRAVSVGQFSHLNRYQILFDPPRKRSKPRKPKSEQRAIEVHQGAERKVDGGAQQGELGAKQGELGAELGEIGNDTRTPSLERPSERKSERPGSTTAIPLSSNEKKTAREKRIRPENGQEAPAFAELCADLQRIGEESFTGKYRTKVRELTASWSNSEILAAYRAFIENKDDWQMKHAVQEFCEGGAIDRLTNNRKAVEQQARNDEAVRIQQEAHWRQLEIDREAEKQQEAAGNELLDRVRAESAARARRTGHADGKGRDRGLV